MPVNSEVLVYLKNIESPAKRQTMILAKLHRQLRLNNKNGTPLKPGVNSAAL